MLNIYYGRENLDKEKFIFDNLGTKTLMIVPDQYTLEAERQAFRHLGVSALMNLEILSPSRLGSRILSEMGGSKRSFIDKYGRHMLLYRSACIQRENLRVFRGMETGKAFLDSVNNFISEMKQYNCGAEELKEMAKLYEDDSYTQKKLMDVYELFAEYERQTEGKYTDSEDYIDLYINKIPQSALINESQIWVYGFDSFAPKTMALLGQLMAAADELNLVLTWGGEERDSDLFALPSIVMNNVQGLADSLGVKWAAKEISAEYEHKERSPAIRHVEKELYALPAVKGKDCSGLTLVESAGVYNEAESAASYVLHLVRDKGLRYRDIKVICNDTEGRGHVLSRVFEEYGIETFVDTKRDILSGAIVQTVISLLDVVIEKYRTDCVLRALKSGFGDLNADELANLENYVLKYKIKGTMWKKPFKRGTAEYGADGLAEVEELRAKAIEPMIKLENVFAAETTGQFIKDFYKFLCDDINLPQKVLQFISIQEEKGLTELADETSQIWNSVIGILEQMHEIMGDEEFEPRVFRDIFETGLSQVEIGLLPPTEDGLLIGTMQRSRTGKIRALVVVGANEGILPQEKPSQGIFSAEERELFKREGKELCKVDSVRFMEERMAIYRNLSAPTEYLWVSCSLSDGEGNQTKPSRIFLKLKELFPELEVKRDVLNTGEAKPLINSNTGGLRHLTEALQSAGEGREVPKDWEQALAWFKSRRPAETEKIRNALAFTNRQEDLGRQAASALFKKDTDEALSLSPSRLERFSRCPFSHLVLYGLRPLERRIFEAAPREIGDIYHQCLMEMTRALTLPGIDITDEHSPWMTVTRAECDELVSGRVREITESYREGLFKDSNADSYRGERVAEICSRVCWTVVEQVRAGQIKDIKPEIRFGKRDALPPIEIKLDDQTVFIEGVIDRVDYLSDDRVKIIDYKTGNESFSIDEASSGYRLQLMLYLQAACINESKPAGVFYFRIKEPMVDFSQRDIDAEYLEKEIRKSFKLDGIMVDDPQVIAGIAGEFGGFSEIVPIKNTSDGIKNSGSEGLLSEVEFENLRTAVSDKVREACRELAEGKIEAHPMKTKDRSACAYCQYRGICRFDTVFEACSYNIIR